MFEGMDVPGVDIACSREKRSVRGVGDTDAVRGDAYPAKLLSAGP